MSKYGRDLAVSQSVRQFYRSGNALGGGEDKHTVMSVIYSWAMYKSVQLKIDAYVDNITQCKQFLIWSTIKLQLLARYE